MKCFLVDVGAAHPRGSNDTYALYEAGWRGINIEPDAERHRQLLAERPKDKSICAAVSDTGGKSIDFFQEEHFEGLSDYYAERDFGVPEGAFLPSDVFDNFETRKHIPCVQTWFPHRSMP